MGESREWPKYGFEISFREVLYYSTGGKTLMRVCPQVAITQFHTQNNPHAILQGQIRKRLRARQRDESLQPLREPDNSCYGGRHDRHRS